jgi:nucleoside-triphosphatase
VGKTTVLTKTVELLKARGVDVGGMVSLEARRNNVRVGFEIVDLHNGGRGWLAHINGIGPSVGKYHVKLPDLENIGVNAITEATQHCQVVAIDEIGPMELISKQFKHAVTAALENAKPVLAVVHAKAKDSLITLAKQRSDATVYAVTPNNREDLPPLLAEHIWSLLEIECRNYRGEGHRAFSAS